MQTGVEPTVHYAGGSVSGVKPTGSLLSPGFAFEDSPCDFPGNPQAGVAEWPPRVFGDDMGLAVHGWGSVCKSPDAPFGEDDLDAVPFRELLEFLAGGRGCCHGGEIRGAVLVPVREHLCDLRDELRLVGAGPDGLGPFGLRLGLWGLRGSEHEIGEQFSDLGGGFLFHPEDGLVVFVVPGAFEVSVRGGLREDVAYEPSARLVLDQPCGPEVHQFVGVFGRREQCEGDLEFIADLPDLLVGEVFLRVGQAEAGEQVATDGAGAEVGVWAVSRHFGSSLVLGGGASLWVGKDCRAFPCVVKLPMRDFQG